MTRVNSRLSAQARIVRIATRVTVGVAVTTAVLAVAPSAGADTPTASVSVEVVVPLPALNEPGDWPWLKPAPR